MVHQKAQESSIVQRKTPGVGLEEWRAVAKCSGEVPPHHFSLTIFGNLEDFFVSLFLLSCCFVILIKYSRAQRGDQALHPHHYPSLLL